MGKLKPVILFILALLLPSLGWGATYNAADCSVAAIETELAKAAASGDTINVPAGACTWSAGLTLSKSIALIGAGAGLGAGSPSCNPATDTCITSDTPLNITTTGTIADGWRISGISFTTTTSGDTAVYSGVSTPTYKDWRIDHCKFVGYHFGTYFKIDVETGGGNSPLLDHNEFYGGGVQFFGTVDTPWTGNTALGTEDFVFIENNKFYTQGALTAVLHFIAANGGIRIISRFNDFKVDGSGVLGNLGDIFDAHGYCHGANIRAVRAYEIYRNALTRTGTQTCSEGIYLRGGTGLVYENKLGCETYTRGVSVALYDYRASNMDATGTETCSASCNTNAARKPYCYATYYRLKTANDPATAFSSAYNYTVTGQTSGASGTVIGYTNSGDGGVPADHYYIYFLAITGGPFSNGENLQVGGVTKTTAAAASESQSGEGAGNCCDMIGKGKDQASDPLYIWGNTDKDGNALNDAAPTGMQSGYITLNTDYVLSTKPEYTAYQFPHPLDTEHSGWILSSADCQGADCLVDGATNHTVTPTTSGDCTPSLSPSVATAIADGNTIEITATFATNCTLDAVTGITGTGTWAGQVYTFTSAAITADKTITFAGKWVKLLPWVK